MSGLIFLLIIASPTKISKILCNLGLEHSRFRMSLVSLSSSVDFVAINKQNANQTHLKTLDLSRIGSNHDKYIIEKENIQDNTEEDKYFRNEYRYVKIK
jgi:hypothetical protein